MAKPGSSNHQQGTGVDIMLGVLEEGRIYNLTPAGCVLRQVETVKAWGQKYLTDLEDIMFAGGFRHMCGEVWHFDFGPGGGINCEHCDFPGTMQEYSNNEKKKKSSC